MEQNSHADDFTFRMSSDSGNVNFVLGYVSMHAEVSSNKSAYKLQRICKVCSYNFKDSLLKKDKSKKTCRFCYEAVCKTCSSVKLYTPLEVKKKRICTACLNKALLNYFKSFEKLDPAATDIEALKSDSEFVDTLKDLVELKRSEFREKQEEIQIFQISKVPESQPEVSEKYEDLKDEYGSYVKMLDMLDKNIEVGENEIHELRRNLSACEGLIEEAKCENKEEKENSVETENKLENVLREQIIMLKGLFNVYSNDSKKLNVKCERKSSCLIQ